MTMLMEKNAPAARVRGRDTPQILDINFSDIESSLRGINYPATRSDLIERAKINNATTSSLSFLEVLPKSSFYQFDDVAQIAWSYLVM
jgi:hypothetical protein